MKRMRELVGLALLAAGVGGVFVGVHGVSGGEAGYGGPALGAGAVANVLAYRVLRTTTRPTGEAASESSAGSAGRKT